MGRDNEGDIMAWKLSKTSLERRQGVDPRLIEISDRALDISLVDLKC